jgi:hypothetical protein
VDPVAVRVSGVEDTWPGGIDVRNPGLRLDPLLLSPEVPAGTVGRQRHQGRQQTNALVTPDPRMTLTIPRKIQMNLSSVCALQVPAPDISCEQQKEHFGQD